MMHDHLRPPAPRFDLVTPEEAKLIAGLLRSGMRETCCALCGCQLWNREPLDPSVCPPCEDAVFEAQLTTGQGGIVIGRRR